MKAASIPSRGQCASEDGLWSSYRRHIQSIWRKHRAKQQQDTILYLRSLDCRVPCYEEVTDERTRRVEKARAECRQTDGMEDEGSNSITDYLQTEGDVRHFAWRQQHACSQGDGEQDAETRSFVKEPG